MIQQRAAAMNLDFGDGLRVQCTNHERDTVLHFAEWMVYSRKSRINVAELSDQVTRTSEVYSHALIRTRDWTATPAAREARTVIGKAVWNVGRGGYAIEADGVEVGFVPVRPDNKAAEKTRAQTIAAGASALPAPGKRAARTER